MSRAPNVVRFIEMRRFIGNKAFKGTVNVEFNTKEEAEAFLKKKIEFAGEEITDKQMLCDREKDVAEHMVAVVESMEGRSASTTARTVWYCSRTLARRRRTRSSRSF